MTKYLFLFILFCFGMNALSAQQDGIAWYNKEMVIKGEYLHAVLVAEKEFSGRMAGRAEKSEGSGSSIDSKAAEYLSNIENYNVEVGVGKGRYLVWFSPRLSAEFPVIFGGDALFTIDSNTFQILDKQYGK